MSAGLSKQKNLISISQAAKFLGVSIDTVRRWDSSSVLHSERPDGKNRYFSLSELEKHKSGQPLPISEAAKELGVSPTTLRRLETRGLLKPQRNNAGERVYNKNSIKDFLNSDYFRRKNHDSDYFRRKNHDSDYFRRKNHDIDYFLRKKTLKENHSAPDHIIETKTQHHENKNPEPRTISKFPTPSISIEEIFSNTNKMSSHRMPEVLATVVIFALLSAIGATNITLSEIRSIQSSKSPAVLSETVTYEEPEEEPISAEIEEAEPSPDPVTLEYLQSLLEEAADYDPNEATKAAEEKKEESGSPDLADFKIILSINTGGAEFINIREKPSTESGKINEARDGDTFEMVSRDSDWYQIKLNNGSNGFISEEFAEIREIN